MLPISLNESILNSEIADDLKLAFKLRICPWAWCLLHNIGKERYRKINAWGHKMEIDCHGNTGNKNCQKPLGDAPDSIRWKLKHAELTLACPFATKIVRDVAGVITHQNNAEDDEVQPVFLPPNFLMQALYLEWI